jgi:flagellar hook-associated protein 2
MLKFAPPPPLSLVNSAGRTMATSIATTLGIGSGIDTTALVDQLSAAARAPKDAALKAREDLNTAQISALGNAASGIDNFATALTNLISGGTLFTQPTTSDSSVLTAAALPGARIGDLSAQIEVLQLAQSQSLVSEHLTGSDAAVGQGALTLTTGGHSFDIVIGSSNDSLAGLAAAINAASGAGISASVVKDSLGARLVLKGATGADKAFTLAAAAGSDPALSRFAYDPNIASGMTRAQKAQDAMLKLDGVELQPRHQQHFGPGSRYIDRPQERPPRHDDRARLRPADGGHQAGGRRLRLGL